MFEKSKDEAAVLKEFHNALLKNKFRVKDKRLIEQLEKVFVSSFLDVYNNKKKEITNHIEKSKGQGFIPIRDGSDMKQDLLAYLHLLWKIPNYKSIDIPQNAIQAAEIYGKALGHFLAVVDYYIASPDCKASFTSDAAHAISFNFMQSVQILSNILEKGAGKPVADRIKHIIGQRKDSLENEQLRLLTSMVGTLRM